MSRWLVRLAALTGALSAISLILPGAVSPAKADGFRFSYSSGGYYGPGPYHPHRHWGPRYRPHHYAYGYYAPPVVYAPAPVYAPPPVVYAPPSPAYSTLPTVTPASPTYRTADGRYCREYQSTVTIGGGVQPTYGTACLQPDGSWRIVD